MSWGEFWIILAVCAGLMLVCRVVPLFALKGRSLPASVERGLGFIPPAAFAALVANDLLEPGMFASGMWPAALPFVAAAGVVVVAVRTKSLLLSAVTGVIVYAVLLLI